MTNNSDSNYNLDEVHTKLAKNCFNTTWEYLDKESLTPIEEMEMLRLAHASRYHWSFVGDPRQFAVGDWQISRAYAKINEGSLALKYAQSSLDITLENKVESHYLSAYEGIARAYAVIKDYKKAEEYIVKAETELEKITDKEDREIYGPQIKETRAMIK